MREKCGTIAGYRSHQYYEEETCDACKAAWNEYHRAYRARRKEEQS